MYLNIMGKSSLLLGAHLHYVQGGSRSGDGWEWTGWASSWHSSWYTGYGCGTRGGQLLSFLDMPVYKGMLLRE
jgi:hypothetical protein